VRERVRTIAPPDLYGLAAGELLEALERGHIVRFPRCPVELPEAHDLAFLIERVPQGLARKNVSYHPEADRVVGLDAPVEEIRRAHRILKEHMARVETFLARVAPELVSGWTPGTSSFRPMEERGRNLKPHASNELVHVDAGAYGATHGDRILRFFVNINPTEDRVWATRGTFPELYTRYGCAAGVAPSRAGAGRLREGPIDHLRSAVLRAASAAGLPLARVLDSSPYDRLMRRFHNFMKDSPDFRSGRDGYEELRFGPYSAWMVFTDTVSHACLAGRFALVNTFLVPLANCARQDLAPYAILQRTPDEAAAAEA
jgi:hypothetical protein